MASYIASAGSGKFEGCTCVPVDQQCFLAYDRLNMTFKVASLIWALAAFTGLSHQSPTLHRRDKVSDPLSFSKDGNFKISIFEDLHFGESKSIK